MKTLKPLTSRIKEIALSKLDYYYKFIDIMAEIEYREESLFLGQFIACDEDGKPLEKPRTTDYDMDEFVTGGGSEVYEERIKEYQQAQSKVIFEGWELVDSSEHRMLIERKDGYIIGFFADWIKVFDPHNDNGEYIKTIEDIAHLNLKLKS